MWYITTKLFDLIDFLNIITLTNYSKTQFLLEINENSSNNYLAYLKLYENNTYNYLTNFRDIFSEFSIFIIFQIIINLLIVYSFFYNFWIDYLHQDKTISTVKLIEDPIYFIKLKNFFTFFLK